MFPGVENAAGHSCYHVESFEVFDEAVEAASAAEDGEQCNAVVSFETAEGIRKPLTDRRRELLRSLMGGRPRASRHWPSDLAAVKVSVADRGFSCRNRTWERTDQQGELIPWFV